MTVLRIIETKGRSVTIGKSNSYKRRRRFKVKLDTARRDQTEVYDVIPPRGAIYEDPIDGHTDPFALCTDITIEQDEQNPQWHKATCEYSTDYDNKDQPSNPAEPWSLPPKVDVGEWFKQVPCIKDKDGKGVTNSALDPFRDPIEEEDGFDVFQIVFYKPTSFDVHGWRAFRNAVNSDTFQGFVPRQLWCRSATATFQTKNNLNYFEHRAELVYNPDKWDVVQIDRGLREYGFGQDSPKNILDKYGQPITEPALLDGIGFELKGTNLKPENVKYITTRRRREMSFSSSVLASLGIVLP